MLTVGSTFRFLCHLGNVFQGWIAHQVYERMYVSLTSEVATVTMPIVFVIAAHDFHHAQNMGNYGGFFMFWDHICGTDSAYCAWKEGEGRIPKRKSAE